MEQHGAESIGPLSEVDEGLLRRFARFVFRLPPNYEPMDLSGLTDENDPPGLAMTVGGPRNQRELYERIKDLQDQGSVGPLRIDRGYGFRPVGSSLPPPLEAEGAPILYVARGLRARREGRLPLSSGVSHPEAKKLLDDIYSQRPKPESPN